MDLILSLYVLTKMILIRIPFHNEIIFTGIGSTKAGLTVSAVRDGNNWALEPGALVLGYY